MADVTDGQERALWPSTVQIKQGLGLNETRSGLLAGLPILTGSLCRIFLGACETVASSGSRYCGRGARYAG